MEYLLGLSVEKESTDFIVRLRNSRPVGLHWKSYLWDNDWMWRVGKLKSIQQRMNFTQDIHLGDGVDVLFSIQFTLCTSQWNKVSLVSLKFTFFLLGLLSFEIAFYLPRFQIIQAMWCKASSPFLLWNLREEKGEEEKFHWKEDILWV